MPDSKQSPVSRYLVSFSYYCPRGHKKNRQLRSRHGFQIIQYQHIPLGP